MVDYKVTLFWKQRNCKLTVPLGKADNVATFTLTDGFKCVEAEVVYGIKQKKTHHMHASTNGEQL
jgi:hypothetical protein